MHNSLFSQDYHVSILSCGSSQELNVIRDKSSTVYKTETSRPELQLQIKFTMNYIHSL